MFTNSKCVCVCGTRRLVYGGILFQSMDSQKCVCVCVCVCVYRFPSFSVFSYSRMYVRVSLGPVGACVRLCLRVAFDADTPSATRARDIRISVLWMRFGEWDLASIQHWCWCVVVGCCVRTYGTRCLVFGDTLFHTLFQTMDLQVCVCVCVCRGWICFLFESLGCLNLCVTSEQNYLSVFSCAPDTSQA